MTNRYNPAGHHRRSIRLPDYDYTQAGLYFVTVCTHGGEEIFADPLLRRVIETFWQRIPRHFPGVTLDAWVVMPNHLHGILIIHGDGDGGGRDGRGEASHETNLSAQPLASGRTNSTAQPPTGDASPLHEPTSSAQPPAGDASPSHEPASSAQPPASACTGEASQETTWSIRPLASGRTDSSAQLPTRDASPLPEPASSAQPPAGDASPLPEPASSAQPPAGDASPLPPYPQGVPSGSLGAIVGNFKSVTARRINQLRRAPGTPVWQRNYYEHIIRGERALRAIRRYIAANPANWTLDPLHPAATITAAGSWDEDIWRALQEPL